MLTSDDPGGACKMSMQSMQCQFRYFTRNQSGGPTGQATEIQPPFWCFSIVSTHCCLNFLKALISENTTCKANCYNRGLKQRLTKEKEEEKQRQRVNNWKA